MYYLLYGFLYALSLLPWRVWYFISDVLFLILYYLIRYRKQVVLSNLKLAFPEKTDDERIVIAKAFYHNFLDSFIETLKFLSISDAEFSKRVSGNFELISELYKTGQNLQMQGGHFFNWEYMNWAISKYSPYPWIAVYANIENKVFNKLMLKLRGRYHAILVPVSRFISVFHELSKKQYCLGLAADQNAQPDKGYWVKFFGKRTPFVTGPEKGALATNAAVVFGNFYKKKRGYYHVDFTLITTEPRQFARGELTILFVRFLEECIRKKPDNYLWSHRRWKWEHGEKFKNKTLE